MAKNRMKDKVMKVMAIVSVALCVAFAALALVVNLYDDGNYAIQKSKSMTVTGFEQITAEKDAISNNKITLGRDIVVPAGGRIGSDEYPFSGVFDGNGYTVTVLYDGAPSSLFGSIAKGAVICNVNFVLGNLSATNKAFGAIANLNEGTIQDCTVEATSYAIAEEGIFSPLALVNRGTISNVVVTGSVKSAIAENREGGVLYAGVCVYNYGKLSGVMADTSFEGFKCMDKFSVLSGQKRNHTLGAVRLFDLQSGATLSAGAVVSSDIYTADMRYSGNSNPVLIDSDREAVYAYDVVFGVCNFNREIWKLSGGKLKMGARG